jgi:hypothetical protein
MLGTVILTATACAELVIFVYVTVCMIPWKDLRERRRIRIEVARMIPSLRERATSVAASAADKKNMVRAARHLQMAEDMTADIIRFAACCQRSITTIEKEYARWPRESLQSADIVASTLDDVERILRFRDEDLPEHVRLLTETVRERIDGLESLHAQLWFRLVCKEKDGVPMPYESRRLVMLSNAMCAHRLAVNKNPDAVLALLPEWADVIPAIAESIEFRAVVTRCVREIRNAHLSRVKRVRELAHVVNPAFSETPESEADEFARVRFILANDAELGIARAEAELHRAEECVALPAKDVGAKGETAGRLAFALRSAKLSADLLDSYESDLTVALALLAAGRGNGTAYSN